MFTDEFWCNVDHQSTENFITGTLTTPTIAIIAVILLTYLFEDATIF